MYMLTYFTTYNLHPSQPFNVTLVPSGHVSHLSPEIPGLHMHFPLICSQSDRTEPCGEQLQTGNKNFDQIHILKPFQIIYYN